MCIRLLSPVPVKFFGHVPLAIGLLLVGAGPTQAQRIEIEAAQVSLIQNTLVAAPISGVVASVHVHEGDPIGLDTPIAQLDDEQAETELEAAEAAYEAARLEADNDVDARYAQRTLEVRQRELQQSVDANRTYSGAVSETEIDKLRLVVDQSRLAIEQAEHQQQVATAKAIEKVAAVQIARTRLAKYQILAPVDGLVVEVSVEPGEWVEAGKPIARLISLDPIRVECFVDGRKHGGELVGRKVEFSYSIDDENPQGDSIELFGEVDFVSPELNPVTGQIRLWATIKNPNQRARAGMRGRLVIRAAAASE
jgi:RND family efflux transporter MFP subunit